MKINTKMDKRLEGIDSSNRITLSFVRDNATKEEIDKAVYEYPCKKVYRDVYDVTSTLDCHVDTDLAGVLEYLSKVREKVVEFNRLYPECKFYLDGYGDILGRVWEMVPTGETLRGEKALQKIWKEQFKAYANERKELEKYLELKEKFGG